MKYRKKPVVIEAYQMLTERDAREGVCTGGAGCPKSGPKGSWPHVHTLEGDHTWTPGDWVIRGVKGEFYFCKPDIFAATYEPAQEERAPVSCTICGQVRTACGGDVHCSGDCDNFDHDEPGGCHRFVAVEHVPVVQRYQPYPDSTLAVYYAACDCGWRGKTRAFATTAHEDADMHAAPEEPAPVTGQEEA